MALPPSEELSRWTVGHVSKWLAQCSLSAFRDVFLHDSIDGSRLLRLNAQEVNKKYKHIDSKKRKILIDHLNRIESLRQPPTWNAAPYLPPRPSPGSRGMPAPPPAYPDDDGGSDDDDGWSDFDEDADDYLEPASKPLEEDPPFHSGFNTNGNMLDGPEEAYEIPEEDLESIRQQPHSRGFDRKPSMVDRLRDELVVYKGDNRRESAPAVTPPPRPPRSNRSPGGGSPFTERRSVSPAHHLSPAPLPPSSQSILPPEGEYEAMNDVISETQADDGDYVHLDSTVSPQNHYLDLSDTRKRAHRTGQHHSPAAGVDGPPVPARRGIQDRPPEPPPVSRPAQRTRYAYQEVKKPGRLSQEDELSRYDWYHGKISRDHAQMIFQREQEDGMFLIRKSERDPTQPYTLVLWHCDRIWNIPIRKKDSGKFAAGKYKDGETEFSSVAEIVEHFKVVSLNLKSNTAIQGSHTLTIPAPKH